MKKFFSAFLLMAAMAFSVSTFVACNDVVGEIEDVKAQTTQNAANIEQLQADLKAAKDEAAAAAAAALQAAKDAQKAGDDAMAYAKAAEASAQKALEEAIAEASAALQAHIDDFNTKYALINETLGQKADKTELTKAIADLKAELQTEISSVRTSVAELDKKIDDEVSKLNTKIDDNKKAFDKEIADLKAADVAINTELTKLNTYIETVETDLKKEIADSTKALRDAVAKAVEEMNKIKAELVAEDARLAGLINTNAAEIKKNADAIAKNATSIADLRTDLNDLLEEVNAAKELLAAHAEDLKNLKNEISNLKTQFDALTGRVDALFARVQSIVYVPEYSNGKADILYGTLDTDVNVTTAAATDLMVVPHLSTLKYKVNADNAAEVASAIAAAKNALSYEVKTVKTRGQEELVPALEIVNVTAEDGYILVDVFAKNFAREFFMNKKNMYSAALKLSDGNNNTTTEFTNLTAVKTTTFTAAVVPDSERHAIPYDKADTTVVILEGNKLVFSDENGAELSAAQVAKYDLEIKRFLTGPANIVRQEVAGFQNVFEGDKRIFKVGYDAELNDFVFVLGADLTKDYRGNEYKFKVNYTVNGYTVNATSCIELTAKQVSYNIPAIEVPWSVAVAQELSENQELYVKNLVRSTNFEVPTNFEGYSLHSIVQTGTTVRREVTLNGAAASKTDIQATIGDKEITLKLIGNYAFPEYDAENEWNEYTITWVKDHESVRATVSATIKLGKKAAPVVINLPAAELKLVGNNDYFTADVKFLNAALAEYAKFSGFDEAMTRATFKEVWRRLSASNENGNTVTVNDKAGVAENVLYGDGANGAIRLYNSQIAKDGKTVLAQNFTSTINEFWFGVPFTFNVQATVDVPAYLLDYSEADYVVNHNGAKTVFVDARIIDGVYTVSKSDLGKYFTVTNDVDNNNGLQVVFEIKTAGAPKTFNTTTGTPVENNEVDLVYDNAIKKFALVKNQAVIVDWTNGENFYENQIILDAVLIANGAFELDRKPLVLYAKDPLTFTRGELGSEENPIRIKRYTYDNAYAYPVQALSLVSRVEGELIAEDATKVSTMFGENDPETTYGATVSTEIKGVYTKVYDEAGNVTGKVPYETGKTDYTDGVLTLWGDEAILNSSIFAEVEFKLSNHRFDEKTDAEHIITVHVEFYPATK